MVQPAILANVEAQAEGLQIQGLHEHLTPALAAEQTLTLNKNVKERVGGLPPWKDTSLAWATPQFNLQGQEDSQSSFS